VAPEWAASILEPHFDAVRDEFLAFVPRGASEPLSRIAEVRFVIDEAMHDTERHYAATRTDGTLMLYAPQIVDLPLETLVAIIAHEFGHAVDHLYPGAWTWPFDSAGICHWVGESTSSKAKAWRASFGRRRAESRSARDDEEPAANWMRAWEDRPDDSVEWAADGICEAITGKRPRYCGRCLLQSFARCGVERPAGLR